LEITKTVLSLMLVVITILTTLTLTTTIAAVYAGGDDDDNREGNKQKAEDDSSAAIADCDHNDVERAGFDCIAIAANDVEIEPPEESATLSVCKELGDPTLEPDDFTFTFEEGNNPLPSQFQGDNADGCVDVTIGPGEYTVSEAAAFTNFGTRIEEGSDCVQDPIDLFSRRATGEIQAGETQECRFFNFRD
jgi:hypothetical protein